LQYRTYGCETWVVDDGEKKKLEGFEIWCWRNMERMNWIERKTNELVLSTVGEKRTLKVRAWCWKMVGHALRNPSEIPSEITGT